MRRRWTEERRLQRQQADWIVGYLRENGPLTTREIVEALRNHDRSVESHIITRALRKSPFITSHIELIDGEEFFLWRFETE